MKLRNTFIFFLVVLVSSVFLIDCANKKSSDGLSEENYTVFEDDELVMNKLTRDELNDGWELLFDGESMDGWKLFQSDVAPEGWKAADGMLIAPGEGGDIGGDIITEKEFENFQLKWEWRIAEGGNSGLMYRVLEGEYSAPYATGPEYQMIDDIGFPDKLEAWQSCGADYAMHAAEKAKLKPANEWNDSELIVDGAHITQFLNGVKVVEFEAWTDEWKELVKNSKWADYPDYGLAKAGHIALQDHGSSVWFRNIKIKEL